MSSLRHVFLSILGVYSDDLVQTGKLGLKPTTVMWVGCPVMLFTHTFGPGHANYLFIFYIMKPVFDYIYIYENVCQPYNSFETQFVTTYEEHGCVSHGFENV